MKPNKKILILKCVTTATRDTSQTVPFETGPNILNGPLPALFLDGLSPESQKVFIYRLRARNEGGQCPVERGWEALHLDGCLRLPLDDTNAAATACSGDCGSLGHSLQVRLHKHGARPPRFNDELSEGEPGLRHARVGIEEDLALFDGGCGLDDLQLC